MAVVAIEPPIRLEEGTMENKEVSVTLNALAHPANVAWQSVNGTQVVAERIDLLQADRHRSIWVWRMFGCGPEGQSIIAKRCRIGDARRERDIYQHILPWLPLLPISFHGYVEDSQEQGRAWGFMEDIGSEDRKSTRLNS